MAETKNGIIRCPNCGASDIMPDGTTGNLKCEYCRTVFKAEAANKAGGVKELSGESIGEGAEDIIPNEKIVLTLKCGSCGSEVVINADEAQTAKCHWCRNVLSINEKLKNGAVPDFVLPFQYEKAKAESNIRDFVEARKFFAHPQFKKEFSTENVLGVYFPYFVVDVNAHAQFKGVAERKVRSYRINKKTYYDADAYDVEREFDSEIDDLTIEASMDKLAQDLRADTKNVINAIMPFDTENAVAWDPRYLRGYTSEKRDVNVGDLRQLMFAQAGDVLRYQAKTTIKQYDRGAHWDVEKFEDKGLKWRTAYLPVWLYSYLEVKNGRKLLHYVAVNARTGETMGSVPINKSRLMAISVLIEIVGLVIGFWWFKYWIVRDVDDDNPAWLGLFGLTPGFIFYWLKYNRYRNASARHGHERETKAEMSNLREVDNLREHRKRLRNSRIADQNDSAIKGAVARNGKELMGEKMANYMGIGRMIGSTPQDTPTGQKHQDK